MCVCVGGGGRGHVPPLDPPQTQWIIYTVESVPMSNFMFLYTTTTGIIHHIDLISTF